MKDPLQVLVLGVGGNVSQSILKALRLSAIPCRVMGACISPHSAGLYLVDKAYVTPRADDPSFPDWLMRTCREEHVHAVLSGVEPVLDVLSGCAPELRRQTGAVAIVSRPEVLAIGHDKLRTCQWLKEHGLAYPRYADAEDRGAVERLLAQCGFPLVVKPRRGKGSHGLTVARDERDVEYWAGRPGCVIEEYLGDETTEYTVGCFSDRDGRVRGAIAMRREIQDGTTYRAVAGDFPAIREEAVRIAGLLTPMGPCNVQLRAHQGRATCFEVNIRFSGTTALRARFGFNDVEATLRHYVLGEPAVDLPQVARGIGLRYWNEVYVEAEARDELSRNGVLERPASRGTRVEDFGIKP